MANTSPFPADESVTTDLDITHKRLLIAAQGYSELGLPELALGELDLLPEVYERRLWEEKVERTYQYVFEHFETVQAEGS